MVTAEASHAGRPGASSCVPGRLLGDRRGLTQVEVVLVVVLVGVALVVAYRLFGSALLETTGEATEAIGGAEVEVSRVEPVAEIGEEEVADDARGLSRRWAPSSPALTHVSYRLPAEQPAAGREPPVSIDLSPARRRALDPSDRALLDKYGHSYEIALVLKVTQSYRPEERPDANDPNAALVSALHRFYAARTPEERRDAIAAIERAEADLRIGNRDSRIARIVDLALRFEAETYRVYGCYILRDLAVLLEQERLGTSAVDHLRLAVPVARYRADNRDAIGRAAARADRAVGDYLDAKTPGQRRDALVRLKAAAQDLPPPPAGARNVALELARRAEAHDALLRVREAGTPAGGARALRDLRRLAETNPNARRTLDTLVPGGPARVDAILVALESPDPAVRDQALRDLRGAVSVEREEAELRALGGTGLTARGVDIERLIDEERALVREQQDASQRRIEEAYERFLAEPTRANLDTLERLVVERRRTFGRNDLDFTVRDARLIDALRRIESGEPRAALADLERLAADDPRAADMLRGLGPTPAARAALSDDAIRRGLPTAASMVGERRGRILLSRLGPESSSRDFEDAATALRAAAGQNPQALDWALWAEAQARLARIREALARNDASTAADVDRAIRELREMAPSNPYAYSALLGLLADGIEKNGRPIWAPRLPRGAVRDSVGTFLAAEVRAGRLTLTDGDARALVRAYAEAGDYVNGGAPGRILQAALTRPEPWTVEGARRWQSQGRIVLRALGDGVAAEPPSTAEGRRRARFLADMMLHDADHPDFDAEALRLAVVAREGNPGAIRVITKVLADSQDPERVAAAFAILKDAMRGMPATVTDEVEYFDYAGRAKNPGALALLLVEGTPRDRNGHVPPAVRWRVKDALARTRTAGMNRTIGPLTPADLDHRRAVDALFKSVHLGWGWDDLAQTILAHRTPYLLARLAENADVLPERDVYSMLVQLRSRLRRPNARLDEVELDALTVAALGSRATRDDIDALTTAYRKVEAGPGNTDEKNRPKRAIGTALVNIMARNPNPEVRARAETAFVRVPAWPGMRDGERELLLRYVRSNGTDLDAYARIQRSAYAAGLPRPMALLLRDAGVRGSDAELIVKGRMLEQRLGGADRARWVIARIEALQALSPDVRAALFGEAFRGPVDPARLIDELSRGEPTSPVARLVLTDGPESVEQKIDSALTQARARANAARRERTAAEADEQAAMRELTRQTGRGPSFWEDLYPSQGPTERFTAEQNDLLARFQAARQRTRNAIAAERDANVDLQKLDLAAATYAHARYLSIGDTRGADAVLLDLFTRYGSGLRAESPELWAKLEEAWPRLKSTTRVAFPRPPTGAPGTVDGYQSALIDARTRGLAPGERAEIMQRINGHPSIREAVGLLIDLDSDLRVIQELYSAAAGGPRTDAGNVREEYVAYVKERARILKQKLQGASAGGDRSLIADLKRIRGELDEAARNAEPAMRDELLKTVRLIDDILLLIDPEAAGGHRVALEQMLDAIIGPDFGPNTWREFARRQLPIIVASLVVAVAAVATVMSLGATSPLLIAVVGTAGGMLGAEVTKETLYWMRKEGILDLGSGRSRVGAWRDGQLVYDAETGRYVKMEFWQHVATPYLKELAVGTLTSLFVMGVGGIAARTFNALGPRLPAALQANRPAINQLRAGTSALEQRVAGKPAEQAFLRRFLKELADESGDELLEAGAERALEKLLSRSNDAVGLAGAALVAIGKGVTMRRVGRTNRIALDGNLDAAARDAIVDELRRTGNTVRVDPERNLIYVTTPNGATWVLGPRAALDRLDGPGGGPLQFECVDASLRNLLRRHFPNARIPDGAAAGFNRLPTFAEQIEALRQIWRTVTNGGDIELLGEFRTRAELEAFIARNPDLFPPGTELVVAGHDADGRNGHLWTMRVDENGRLVVDESPGPAWDRAQLRLFRARRADEKPFGSAATALDGLDPARADAAPLMARVYELDAIEQTRPLTADEAAERNRHLRALRRTRAEPNLTPETALALLDFFEARGTDAERQEAREAFAAWFDRYVRGPFPDTPEGRQMARDRARAFATLAAPHIRDDANRRAVLLARIETLDNRRQSDGGPNPREVALREVVGQLDLRSLPADVRTELVRLGRTVDLDLDVQTGVFWRVVTVGADRRAAARNIAERLRAGDDVRVVQSLTMEERIELSLMIQEELGGAGVTGRLASLFDPSEVAAVIQHQDTPAVGTTAVDGGHNKDDFEALARNRRIEIDRSKGTNGYRPLAGWPGWYVVEYRVTGSADTKTKTVFDPRAVSTDRRRSDVVAALDQATVTPGGMLVTSRRLGNVEILVNIGTPSAPRFLLVYLNHWKPASAFPVDMETEIDGAITTLKTSHDPEIVAKALYRLRMLATASPRAAQELERRLPPGADYDRVMRDLQSDDAATRTNAVRSIYRGDARRAPGVGPDAPPPGPPGPPGPVDPSTTMIGPDPRPQVRVRRTEGQMEDNWRIVSVDRDGTILTEQIGTGALRRNDAAEVLENNPTLVRVGSVVEAKNGNGPVTDSWVVREHLPDGRIRIAKDGVVLDVTAADLVGWNRDRLTRRLAGPGTGRTVTVTGDARTQSETYRTENRIPEGTKIVDGYADGGRGMTVRGDGTIESEREVIVVDRTRDPALRRHLEFARSIRDLPPEERARVLAAYVDALLSPPGGNEVRAAERLQEQNAGKEVLLGDLVDTGSGVCRHRALLFKVLGDEAGLDVALVRGNEGPDGDRLGHAWNEVVLPGGRRVLVDPFRARDGFIFRPPSEVRDRYRKVDDSAWYDPPAAPAPRARGGLGCSAGGGGGGGSGGALLLVLFGVLGRRGRARRAAVRSGPHERGEEGRDVRGPVRGRSGAGPVRTAAGRRAGDRSRRSHRA